MPEISKRGQLMPNSPIRKLVPLAEEADKRGCKVYRLNIGQPDMLTSPNALEAIRNMSANVSLITGIVQEMNHCAGNLRNFIKKSALTWIIRIF